MKISSSGGKKLLQAGVGSRSQFLRNDFLFLLLFLTGVLLTVPSVECHADNRTNIHSFDYYSQEDGLPNNQIQCIFQDNRGWIWLGTDLDLLRIDSAGTLMKITPVSSDGTYYESDLFIRSLLRDNSGNLWIGATQGLFVSYPHENRLEECRAITQTLKP